MQYWNWWNSENIFISDTGGRHYVNRSQQLIAQEMECNSMYKRWNAIEAPNILIIAKIYEGEYTVYMCSVCFSLNKINATKNPHVER